MCINKYNDLKMDPQQLAMEWRAHFGKMTSTSTHVRALNSRLRDDFIRLDRAKKDNKLSVEFNITTRIGATMYEREIYHKYTVQKTKMLMEIQRKIVKIATPEATAVLAEMHAQVQAQNGQGSQ